MIKFHPSYYLKEYLEYVHMSVKDCAAKMGISIAECQELLNGRIDVNLPLAEKLSSLVAGTGANYWLKLQFAYDN